MKRKPTPFILCTLMLPMAGPSLYGATKTYGGAGTLSASSSWSPSGTPVTTDEALFTGTPGTAISTAAGTNLSFGDFLWNNNVSSTISLNTTGATNTNLTLTAGGGSTEAIANGGAAGDLLLLGTNATTNTVAFTGNAGAGTGLLRLVLGSSGNVNVVNAGATLSLGVRLSGAFGINKTGAGTLVLDFANTYTGTTTLSSGMLALGSSSALGTGPLVINGGSLASITSARTPANNITVGGNFSLGGLGSAITLAGTVDLGGTTRTVTLDNSATISGQISNGGLTVAGSSRTLTLTHSNNTYSGATLVSSGTLLVNGALSNSSSTTASSGATVGGDGSIANSLTIHSGAFLQPGTTTGAVGSLDTGALTLAGTYIPTITANGVNDFLNIAGSANFTGATISPFLSAYTPVLNDAFNIADWTGGFSGTPSFDFTNAALGGGLAWDTSTFTTDGTLRVISAVPEPQAVLLGSIGLLALLRRRR